MKLIILFVIFSGLTVAQSTQISLSQVRADATPIAQIIVVLPNGSYAQADIDPATIFIDTTGPRPVLKAITAPSIGSVDRLARFTLAPTGIQTTFDLSPFKPMANTLPVVTRSGLTMARGVDYTWIEGSSVISFNAGALPKGGDIITIAYKTAQ